MELIIFRATTASNAIKDAQQTLESLLEKPGASNERDWTPVVRLLRDDLQTSFERLSALIANLYTAACEDPESIERACCSLSTAELKNGIATLQTVVEQSVGQCASRLEQIQTLSWWTPGAYKANLRASFREGIYNKILRMRTYREAIFEARTQIAAARTTIPPEVKKLTARCAEIMKQQLSTKGVDSNLSLAQKFSVSPFRVHASRTDSETSSLANQLVRIYRRTTGLEDLRRLFEGMGETWANEGSRTTSVADLEAAHRTLSDNVALALTDSIKVPAAIHNSTLEDTRLTISRLTAWCDSSATCNLTIAIGGEFSHGKSSVLNALMGAEFLPTGGTCCVTGKAEDY